MTIYVILTGLVYCGMNVIFSKNPIHSILNLILAFVISTLLFLSINVEFIAMLFLIIYIGAIAVLFLFVVMMLNIKIVQLHEQIIRYMPVATFILIVFFLELIFLINSNFIVQLTNDMNFFFFTIKYYQDYFFLVDNYLNLHAISYSLYTKYVYMFIIASIILLLAILGSILLTLMNISNHKVLLKLKNDIIPVLLTSLQIKKLDNVDINKNK